MIAASVDFLCAGCGDLIEAGELATSATYPSQCARCGIVRASVEMRNVIRSAIGPVGHEDARVVQAVIDAVNGAGL